ncbi:MAG TPA: hypothetical protein VKC60_09840 [Opitutaceae bacterium]|nr:hypothetical protein [Opitutaceae bacterium]
MQRTASATISTPRTKGASAAGFTLVEVMVSATLSVFVLAAILSTFLMMGRSGANVANYVELETRARKGLEKFSEDARNASGILWNDAVNSNGGNSVTLTIPNAADSTTSQVTYYWDTTSGSATYQCFCSKVGDASSTNPPATLVKNVSSFGFDRYKIGGSGAAANDTETKQLQITLTTVRTSTTAVAVSEMVLSARYILRNKKVTA